MSPIDLIPDFIPVLGLMDDLLLVPLGIWATLRLLPDDLLAEFRRKASRLGARPNSIAGMLVVLAIWLGLAASIGLFLIREV